MIHRRRIREASKDERGSASVFAICLLPAILALGGLAIDGANAWRMQTLLQATADVSAHAAALDLPNKDTAATTALAYVEKNLPAEKNGALLAEQDFKTGNWNGPNRVFTPDGAPLNAVKVILRRYAANGNAVPTSFLRLIGWDSWDVSVSAIAAVGGGNCLLALAESVEEGILSNGAQSALECDVMSNGTATCNGGDLAPVGSAHLANNRCGVVQHSYVPTVADPYSDLASNIPPDTCDGYPQSSKHGLPLPAINLWIGAKNLSGNTIVCGDLQLIGDVTVNAPSGGVLILENGELDTNGHTLQTANGSALTVVFTGTNSASYDHFPTGDGNNGTNDTLDFNAPTSGPWSGVAMYQDPNLTSGVSFDYRGNNPTWNITGLVYLPHASITFRGDVNKSHNGHSCFALVMDNITIDGTGNILAHGECPAAGLILPGAHSLVQLVD